MTLIISFIIIILPSQVRLILQSIFTLMVSLLSLNRQVGIAVVHFIDEEIKAHKPLDTLLEII